MSRSITHGGTTMSLKSWALAKGLSYATLYDRLRLGWTVEDALEKPVRASTRQPRGRVSKHKITDHLTEYAKRRGWSYDLAVRELTGGAT